MVQLVCCRMPVLHEFSLEWPLCWRWRLWCPRQMLPCQRSPTSNRLTFFWAHALWWFLRHCSSTPPLAIWENALLCARRGHSRFSRFSMIIARGASLRRQTMRQPKRELQKEAIQGEIETTLPVALVLSYGLLHSIHVWRGLILKRDIHCTNG